MTYENGIPDYAMVPAREIEERAVVAASKAAIYSPVQVTDITEKPKTTITLEEDILVPDTKPDLMEILTIDGKAHLSAREESVTSKGEDYIGLSGEIELQTLYRPEKKEGSLPMVSIHTVVPFKDRWHTPVSAGAAVILDCTVEKIEYLVINERKYRVKIILAITAKEYNDQKIDIFEGIAGEDLQMLKSTVEMSGISLRTKDTLSIKEDLIPKDDVRPESILKQDISVAENYKQISGDKVVINGFIYVNLLYFSAPDTCSSEDDTSEDSRENSAALKLSAENIHQHQEKIEFTQFIAIKQGEKHSGCSVTFDDSHLHVKIVQNEGSREVFRLEGELLTYLELYKNTEREVIIDSYHREKDFVCRFEEKTSRTLIGTSTGESSVREIISAENTGCDVERILYTSCNISCCESHCEQGRIVTEGTLSVNIICCCENNGRNIFTIKEEVPFRVVTSMPQLTGCETVTQKACVKDIWSEKINGKQIEINATILICAEIMRPTPFKVLTDPGFMEPCNNNSIPPMVVYVCKQSDDLWKIAKKFKTTVASIRSVNELEDGEPEEGRKLLIIK